MLSRLREYLAGSGGSVEEYDGPERVQVAICVLLLEVAHADEEFSEEEREAIVEALARRHGVDAEEAREVVAEAARERERSSDLQGFTRNINAACSREEKETIIEEVWRVIYQDDRLDGHEDYVAHKLARLLNLNHKQLIDAKVRVLDERRG